MASTVPRAQTLQPVGVGPASDSDGPLDPCVDGRHESEARRRETARSGRHGAGSPSRAGSSGRPRGGHSRKPSLTARVCSRPRMRHHGRVLRGTAHRSVACALGARLLGPVGRGVGRRYSTIAMTVPFPENFCQEFGLSRGACSLPWWGLGSSACFAGARGMVGRAGEYRGARLGLIHELPSQSGASRFRCLTGHTPGEGADDLPPAMRVLPHDRAPGVRNVRSTAPGRCRPGRSGWPGVPTGSPRVPRQ